MAKVTEVGLGPKYLHISIDNRHYKAFEVMIITLQGGLWEISAMRGGKYHYAKGKKFEKALKRLTKSKGEDL